MDIVSEMMRRKTEDVRKVVNRDLNASTIVLASCETSDLSGTSSTQFHRPS